MAAAEKSSAAASITTELVLLCLQDIGSAALQQDGGGGLSRFDRSEVARILGCTTRLVQARFDRRVQPKMTRGPPPLSVAGLADKFQAAATLAQQHTAGRSSSSVISYNRTEIAKILGMSLRNYGRYHDGLLLELMVRDVPVKGTWGRDGTLLELLFGLIDNTHTSMYISSFYFSHRGVAERVVAAKNRGVIVVIIADKKTMWNKDCHDIYEYLLVNNMEIYTPLDAAMQHTKQWIYDGRIIVDGSFNITVTALGKEGIRKAFLKPKNTESCTITTDRAQAVKDIDAFEAACKAGKLVTKVESVTKGFSTSTDDRQIVRCPTTHADSASPRVSKPDADLGLFLSGDATFTELQHSNSVMSPTAVMPLSPGTASQKPPPQNSPKVYMCFFPDCGKRFTQKGNLNRHSLIHGGDKKWCCETCGKGFLRKADWKTHTRVHTGEKPYKCEYGGCGKRFARSSDRRGHERSHEGIKRFVCGVDGCTYKTARNPDLFRHQRARHTLGQ